MQVPILLNRFYVYEHLRADNGAVFYVGKGTGKRCHIKGKAHRNTFWQNIVQKAGGFQIRIVANGLPEDLAFLVEIERIDQLRAMGVRLCNLTDGGDGVTGWVRTPEWKEKVGKAHRGKTVSQETRDKISRSVRATGYRHPEEVRRRMSVSRMGHTYNLGRKQPEAERIKRANSLKGNKSRSGQKRSEREKMLTSEAMKGRPQSVLICPHCGKSGGNAMRRWHFSFCPNLVNK